MTEDVMHESHVNISSVAGRHARPGNGVYSLTKFGVGAFSESLRQELAGQMEIVMRVYFEKPRSTIGWKGLINDPHLDGTYDMETGLKKARRLLLELTALGLPNPRAWQPTDEDWKLPENWQEIILEGFRERLEK